MLVQHWREGNMLGVQLVARLIKHAALSSDRRVPFSQWIGHTENLQMRIQIRFKI